MHITVHVGGTLQSMGVQKNNSHGGDDNSVNCLLEGDIKMNNTATKASKNNCRQKPANNILLSSQGGLNMMKKFTARLIAVFLVLTMVMSMGTASLVSATSEYEDSTFFVFLVDGPANADRDTGTTRINVVFGDEDYEVTIEGWGYGYAHLLAIPGEYFQVTITPAPGWMLAEGQSYTRSATYALLSHTMRWNFVPTTFESTQPPDETPTDPPTPPVETPTDPPTPPPAPTNATLHVNLGANPTVDVNGNRLNVNPIIRNDRTLVPLRAIADAFGVDVSWNGALQRITIYMPEGHVYLTVGSTNVIGANIPLDVAPLNENGTVFMPARFFAYLLDVEVSHSR